MELQDSLDKFAELGIEVVAISANPEDVAKAAVEDWGLDRLPVGFGLTPEDVERWGLFASAAIKDTEPDWFVEPGTFVVRGDGTLYASIVQTMPFSRPSAEQLLSSLSWIVDKDYPARGEFVPGAG